MDIKKLISALPKGLGACHKERRSIIGFHRKGGEAVTVVEEKRAKRGRGSVPSSVLELLPPSLCLELEGICRRGLPIEEIRLRADRAASVTSCGENIMLTSMVGGAELSAIFDCICEGSLYAYADTIRQGYVTAGGGVRVGVTGRAAVSGGEVVGVYDVSALCFRLPRRVSGIGEPVCKLLREMERGRGVLVYSPPGEGKTTLLRAVASSMAGGDEPWRVVVVDTRGELGYALEDSSLCLEVMTGYPKALGMEIAARTMNAQLIVCDEIGGAEEAEAILGVQNCGVPLLASAHGESVRGVLRRRGMDKLHRAGAFGAYVGIRRTAAVGDYSYRVELCDDGDGNFDGA